MKRLHPLIPVVLVAIALAVQSGAANARRIQTAILAGGCFWCVESDFDKVRGVVETVSGFTGGKLENPTYARVSRGGTGHYESVRIRFDADVISYRQLLDIFWRTIDPTDPGGQFCDRGKTYRTAIFVASPAERKIAEASKAAANKILKGQIVTEILPAATFYPAEAYHQNYHAGTRRVWTRFGYITQARAYKNYRAACGRDKRVRAIWGNAAPFAP